MKRRGFLQALAGIGIALGVVRKPEKKQPIWAKVDHHKPIWGGGDYPAMQFHGEAQIVCPSCKQLYYYRTGPYMSLRPFDCQCGSRIGEMA